MRKAETISDADGRVYLRPLVDEDVTEAYLAWFRDSEVTRFLDSRNITREEAIRNIHRGRESGAWFMHAVVLKAGDLHIGNVKVGPIQEPHKLSDLVTVIGDRRQWGKGYATEAVRLGIRIAFERYGLRKLSVGVVDGNEGSIKCYMAAGFVEEGRLKDQYLIDGEPRDRICLGCLNPRYTPVDA